MKLSGIKWVFLVILIPALVLAEKESSSTSLKEPKSETLDVKQKSHDSSSSVKLNATTTAVGEARAGRKIGCKGGSGSGSTDIFSGFGNIFSDFSSLFNSSSFMLPNLDLNSLSGSSDKLGLFALNKITVPAFFAVALITGLIVAGIAILIPSIKEGSNDSIFNNMMDNLYNFMQSAISSGEQQYGPPSDGGYSSGGYSSNSGGYSSPQVPSQPTYNAPSSGYNAPSSTYTDPSSSYSPPNRRYNYVYSQQQQQQQQQQPVQQQAQYQALQSNYLRSEKSKRK